MNVFIDDEIIRKSHRRTALKRIEEILIAMVTRIPALHLQWELINGFLETRCVCLEISHVIFLVLYLILKGVHFSITQYKNRGESHKAPVFFYLLKMNIDWVCFWLGFCSIRIVCYWNILFIIYMYWFFKKANSTEYGQIYQS